MELLKVGVFGTSKKKQEKRVPIHPDQLEWIEEEYRNNLFFEKGYGEPYGMGDEQLTELCGGVMSRSDLFKKSDVALLAKPIQADFDEMKVGTIHWGWPHCVQQKQVTQTAIDNKLTLIAWEAMHSWSKGGDWQMHVFHKNNEIAGYAGVQHAMNLAGIDGNYGSNRKAVVLSFGSVSRGAIRALQARGIQDISVYTQRDYFLVADQMAGVNYSQFELNESGSLVSVHPDGSSLPFAEELKDADIIVNGILQDTDKPLMFVEAHQNHLLKKGCLIVDVSCDEGMGFSFAKPTSFDEPMFKVETIRYYAVDHTPSYLWDCASWEISIGVISYLPIVMAGSEEWKNSETIRRAIEINEGVIVNSKILSFQERNAVYPHLVI